MELSTLNVVNALRTVSVEKTRALAFQLGVEDHVLDDIAMQCDVTNRKTKFIQAWLNADTGATWKKLVSGLKQIKMNVVAKNVESAFVPKTELPVPATISVPLSPATSSPMRPVTTPAQSEVAPVASMPVAPTPAIVDPKPFNPGVTSAQLSARVVEVKVAIKEFEDAFSELMSDTRSSMSDKESQDRKFLDKFRDHLLVLPVSKRAIHVKFFYDSEDDILEAKNIRKLFAILSRYCNYTNYEIILHLVEKFCEAALKTRMLNYRDSLEKFEKATTIDIYLCAISARRKILEAFSQMVVKINKPASVCTLHEIRQLKEELAETAALHSYCVYIESVAKSSVRVVLRFPLFCIRWIRAALTPDFQHTHHLIEVSVDGKDLTVHLEHMMDEEYARQLQFELDTLPDVQERHTDSSQRVMSDEECSRQLQLDPDTRSDVEETDRELSVTFQRDQLPIMTDEEYARQLQFELDTLPDVQERDTDSSQRVMSDEEYARQLQCEQGVLASDSDVSLSDQEDSTDINDQLRDASWEGDVVRVTSLLNSGADVDGVMNEVGWSALMYAAGWGRTEVVVELVKAGANLNLQNTDGKSTLMYAAIEGRTEVVVELVKAGANLNLQDTDGWSALMYAAWWGRTEVVVELVKAGANLNLQNTDGESALMIAARWGRTEVVVELVKAGANLNLQNRRGDSAVIIATAERESGALRELVRARADLNLQNEEGLTALMISARSGRTELTDILLTGDNIDTDIQENSTGWSALFFSAERGDVATTQLLLRAGASADLKDKSGLTPLDVAAASGSDGVCEVLSKHMQDSATTHSHHDDAASDMSTIASDQDRPTADQDRPTTGQDRPTADQDRPTAGQDTPTTDQDTPTVDQDKPTVDQDTTQTIPIRRQRRVTQAMRNVVNRSGQRLAQLFNQLNRRLKSADEKELLGVRGGRITIGGVQQKIKGRDQNRPSDMSTV